MAYDQFGTEFWDGENFNSIINEKQRTYRGVLNPAKFRGEYMGHNFGAPTMFLGQARIKQQWVTEEGGASVIDHLHGLCLLHDIQAGGWQIAGPWEKACERTYRAVEKHRLYSYAYQFIPYWSQNIVSLPDEDMHVSFFVLRPDRLKTDKGRDWAFYTNEGDTAIPKKVIMIVYNNTEWEGEMRLKPDWKRLGFENLDGLILENAVHSTGIRMEKTQDKEGKEVEKAVFFEDKDEYVKLEDGELVFPMTGLNYRMIVATQPQ
jgi:hypothetical protein